VYRERYKAGREQCLLFERVENGNAKKNDGKANRYGEDFYGEVRVKFPEKEYGNVTCECEEKS
jgi:hypothetical protein